MKKKLEYELCATRLKALADPDRLRIVEQLFQGAMNVSDLSEKLGEEIVKISHHLGVLRHAQVVQSQKQGRFVIYQLHPDVVACGQEATETQTRRIDFGCCSLDLDQS
ncbi:ArsR family transcriptional regulator [Bremerella cremea]|uniref:ArsR family transcriptional regulator n=1 Tax=Blastopirellula marina TaxID=124 RepID=A0A2S8FK46_9BACT|nr:MULTISPECIES: metalloregulator ArsR/SmtB family transcription factor [Pirellulaceae]PQO32521.1 ArsR family transcriptional regulator [Blastopirellula marina]RCS45588.1 ArsR family transcriptional regulator [Bremerella cremea]